jgi:hypothetical protein
MSSSKKSKSTSSTAAHQSETADIDEVADSLRQANTGMEAASGGKRAADLELANAAKRQLNTDSGLEADDSSDNDDGLNGENSDSEGEDILARPLRTEFFESAMQIFNERRLRHPSAWSVDCKFMVPRQLGSFALHSVLMAATTADDFVVLQAMGRQAGVDSLIWNLVARLLALHLSTTRIFGWENFSTRRWRMSLGVHCNIGNTGGMVEVN